MIAFKRRNNGAHLLFLSLCSSAMRAHSEKAAVCKAGRGLSLDPTMPASSTGLAASRAVRKLIFVV